MKYSFLFLLIFFSIDCFSQKEGVFKSDVIVDGDLSEWGEKLDHYDKENQLWYSVANDDDFLYLAIFKDKHALKVLRKGNIEIYISEDKISETSQSIIYPITIGAPIERGGRTVFVPETSWDFLVINNWEGTQSDTISVFNKRGIQAQGEIKQTEEAKDESRRKMASIGTGLVNETDLPVPSKGMTAYLEFAIPLTQVKTISESLNFKIRLKGSSDTTIPTFLSTYQQSAPEGPHKEVELDLMIATEYTFSYTLATNNEINK